MTANVSGQLETNMCKFSWSLKDFSKIGKNVQDYVASPIFNIKDLQWRLKLYPYGAAESSQNFISIFLKLESFKKLKDSFNIYCEIALLDETGAEFQQKSAMAEFGPKDVFINGWHKFIRRDSVVQNTDKFLDDVVNITCTIHMDVYNCREVNISKNILNNYESLFFNENFSDITININNNQMKAHKSILSARSQVFQAMFRHDMEEKNTSTLNITDINYNIMKDILRFIYSGKINNLHKNARNLIPPAEKYGITELKVLCEKSIWKNLKIEDVCETLVFADLYQCSELKAKIMDFIIVNMKEVNKTPGFQELNGSKPKLFEEIFATIVEKKF